MQLTDTQSKLLHAAAQHPEHLLTDFPANLKGGARLKEIGSVARAEIATLTGRKIHLFLHVKVKPDWSEDRDVYKGMGLDWSE